MTSVRKLYEAKARQPSTRTLRVDMVYRSYALENAIMALTGRLAIVLRDKIRSIHSRTSLFQVFVPFSIELSADELHALQDSAQTLKDDSTDDMHYSKEDIDAADWLVKALS